MRETRQVVLSLLLALVLVAWAVPAGAETGEPAPAATPPVSPASGPVTPQAPEVPGAPSGAERTLPVVRPSVEISPAAEARTRGDIADPADGNERSDSVEPGESDEPVDPTTVEVDDAQLRWGINAESHRAAFAPGTFNFLSAGRLGDPGQGYTQIPRGSGGSTWSNGKAAGWQAREGEVRIEKRNGPGELRPATWEGLFTDSAGRTLTTGGSTNSDHHVVIDGGTGVLDPSEGTATIRWKGDFTVVYYSGYSFFYVSDPTLVVEDGIGRIDATHRGYASSMEDLNRWESLPSTTVVLADLGKIDVGADGGLQVTPAYAGVRVSAPSNATPQDRGGPSWGSFPQSFVDFQSRVGTASYWYSSGGAADVHKVASPMTLSWSASSPVAPPAPAPGGPTVDSVENPIVQPPAQQAPTAPAAAAPGSAGPAGLAGLAGTPAAPVESVATPPADEVVPASSTLPSAQPMSTLLAVSALALTRWPWFLGAALLLVAVVVAASPFLRRPSPA